MAAVKCLQVMLDSSFVLRTENGLKLKQISKMVAQQQGQHSELFQGNLTCLLAMSHQH